MEEIFKSIKGYEGLYEVSNLGNVKSFVKYKEGKLLKLGKDKDEYLRVSLRKNEISKTVKVHRLVAIAFIENLNNKPCVNHINNIRNDNRLVNLEWCTNKENINHSSKQGRMKGRIKGNGSNGKCKGDKCYNAKLSWKEVNEIRQSEIKQRDLAVIYNVSFQTISSIINFTTWK